MMRARNAKLNDLQSKSKGASVKAMAAANGMSFAFEAVFPAN